jgi:DNA-binding Xre family transcriptional regulator
MVYTHLKGGESVFSYKRLWKILIDRGMTKEQFRILLGASSSTIAAMGKGVGVAPRVLERICDVLGCQPGDIMEYIPDEKNSSRNSEEKT